MMSCMHPKNPLHLCSLGLYGLPKRNGKLKDISHFDAAFFGVHSKQANTMDPQLRLMMEVAYEAIIDAGEELLALGWERKIGKIAFENALLIEGLPPLQPWQFRFLDNKQAPLLFLHIIFCDFF